jgi:ketosteroid isomerase-like protein
MSAKEVIEAEAKMMRATLVGDARTLEALVHPSFVFLGLRSAGVQAWNRAQWLETLKQIRFHKLEHKARDLQVFGSSAIVTVEGSWRADLRGTTHDEHLLMTDVWLKAPPHGWRIVRRHSTRYVEDEGVRKAGAVLELELD